MLRPRSKKLAVDKFPGEVIIVDFETGTYYSLQKGASIIWELLEEGISENEVMNVFDSATSEQQERIRTFLSDLLEFNLLEKVSPKTPKTHPQKKYEEIVIEKYTDMEDLIMLDPIHEVDERGWPHKKIDD